MNELFLDRRADGVAKPISRIFFRSGRSSSGFCPPLFRPCLLLPNSGCRQPFRPFPSVSLSVRGPFRQPHLWYSASCQPPSAELPCVSIWTLFLDGLTLSSASFCL